MKTYQPTEFKREIEKLNYDIFLKELFGGDLLLTYKNQIADTPRKKALVKRFSCVPLWYLKFLIDSNTTQVVDIGCGDNLFKPVLKKLFNVDVYGIDPAVDRQSVDEFGHFDSDFSRAHTNMYRSAFSINALHFIPLSQLTTRIKEFHNIISPGGHGFLALNTARMIDNSDSQWFIDNFDTTTPFHTQVYNYVYNELSALDINFLVMDVLNIEDRNDYMDGNIRLVFKK